MVNAADIAMMQATSDATRVTPCQILRKASVPDGFGGVTDTWNVISSPLCRLVPYKRLDYEQVLEQRLTLQNRWLIYVTAGTDVNEKDRVACLGFTFEVSSVQAPATVEIERSVLCYLVH